MSTLPKPYLTPEQYLEIDCAAEFESEYDRGTVAHIASISNTEFASRTERETYGRRRRISDQRRG